MPTVQAHLLRHQRRILSGLAINILLRTNTLHFPSEKFGPNILTTVLLLAVISTEMDRRKVTASKIAFYLELPYETARRLLNKLVTKGLLVRNKDRTYALTDKYGTAHIQPLIDLIKKTAAHL